MDREQAIALLILHGFEARMSGGLHPIIYHLRTHHAVWLRWILQRDDSHVTVLESQAMITEPAEAEWDVISDRSVIGMAEKMVELREKESWVTE